MRRAPVPSAPSRWLAAALLIAATGCSSGGDGSTSPSPLPTGTISVNLTPSSVTLAPGSVGGLGVSITRGGGFDGPVTLSASGVPAGVSLTFGSTTVAAVAVSTSINLTVAAGVPAGTTEISIVGTGTGVVSLASKLTLRVQ
jgi:hypothetical protein